MIKNFFDISEIRRIQFRNEINGLRAIAVLGVVIHHADFNFLSGGWLGVDIFFVISGYLISNIIISELNNNSFKFRNFYKRRVKRIIPGLFSTLLICIPFAYWLLTPRAIIEYVNSQVSSILFFSNYFFRDLDFYNATGTKIMPLLHTWSLAIEEQFYIIFPLLCYIIYKSFKNYIIIIFSGLFLYSIFLNSTTSELIKFYEFQYRAWELLLGALIMLLSFKLKIKYFDYVGLGIIFFSFIYFDETMLTLNSLEPKIFINLGIALTLISKSSVIPHKLLSSKVLSIIGISSYSIYLIHQPLFAFIRISKSRYKTIETLLNSNYAQIFALILLFVISYLNWKYVEKYFLKNKLKTSLKFIFLSLIFFFSFTFLSISSEGFKSRYNYIPDSVLYYSTYPNIYPTTYDSSNYKFLNNNCDNKLLNYTYCIWYDKYNSKTIYLIGDSHANALSVSFLIELEKLKDEYNLVFFPATTGRCILTQQSDTLGIVESCSDKFFNEFINLLDKDKDIVIGFGRINKWISQQGELELKCENCKNTEILLSRFEIISNNAKLFYFIEPIPTYSFSIADAYLYKRVAWGEIIYQDKNEWNNKIKDTNKFLKDMTFENYKVINTQNLFCNLNYCFASSENLLYYSDSNHLTLDGANLITNQIELEILKELSN